MPATSPAAEEPSLAPGGLARDEGARLRTMDETTERPQRVFFLSNGRSSVFQLRRKELTWLILKTL
jgi:hypothetical protein